MNDIFENTVLCRKCSKAMSPALVSKNGFNLRVLRCNNCKEVVVHPADKSEYQEFMRLKEKEYNVKMRMVGNSYAVSIPREIVDFMKEQEKSINEMVRLNFEEAGRISLMFNSPESEGEGLKARRVISKEVKVVKGGKPVLHVKRFIDSAHPERNQTKIFKAKEVKEDI